jgi:flagellar biogenesis protein FliO
LSHPRFRQAFWLLVLSAGFVVATSRANAQSRAGDAYAAQASGNSRATVRRPVSPESPPEAPATEATRAAHHKTWKELAREHNQEKAHETQSSGTTPSSTEDKARDTRGHGASLSPWTAVGALAVVIALILILARLFRRHAPLFGHALPSEALEVLGRRFLDQRQSIVLLRVGSRILVVGSSPAGLQGLGEVTDPVEVDLIAGMCRGGKAGLGTSFFGLLKGQAGTQTKTAPRTQASRRPQPRVAEPEVPDVPQSPRSSDPEQELVRRLRAESNPAPLHARSAEVFR